MPSYSLSRINCTFILLLDCIYSLKVHVPYLNGKLILRLIILALFKCVLNILDACLHDEELPPLCKQIGYTSVKLPNHLGHRTVSEAGLELHQFLPIVKVNK